MSAYRAWANTSEMLSLAQHGHAWVGRCGDSQQIRNAMSVASLAGGILRLRLDLEVLHCLHRYERMWTQLNAAGPGGAALFASVRAHVDTAQRGPRARDNCAVCVEMWSGRMRLTLTLAVFVSPSRPPCSPKTRAVWACACLTSTPPVFSQDSCGSSFANASDTWT
eukprot:352515-Chlamydomonas_euryale.AAC.2